MLWGIYVGVAIFQKIHTKPLTYLLLQCEQGDSTSLRRTSVASMTLMHFIYFELAGMEYQ